MQIGQGEFWLGNCLERMNEIPDGSVDCVMTDPPYFIDGMGDDWNVEVIARRTDEQTVAMKAGMKFDVQQAARFENFMAVCAAQFKRVLKPGAFCIVFSQPRLYHGAANGLAAHQFEIRDQLIWRYSHAGQGKASTLDRYAGDKADELMGRKTPQVAPHYESMVLARNATSLSFVENWLQHGVGLIDVGGEYPSNIFTFAKPDKNERRAHPTQKPVALFERLAAVFTKPNDLVLDPFGGNGTTAIAAERTGRRWLCIEREPSYYYPAVGRVWGEVTRR